VIQGNSRKASNYNKWVKSKVATHIDEGSTQIEKEQVQHSGHAALSG